MSVIKTNNVIASAALNWFKQTIGSPAAPSAAAVHAAITLAAGTTTTVTTAISNPDVPRNVTITGNAAGITGNVVITGTNFEDQVITETIVASGTSTVVGNKAFKTVTQIVVPQQNAGGDTISIGSGAKLGLQDRISLDSIFRAYLNGVKEATAPTVAADASNIESNTVTLNSTLNGNPVVVVYFR